MGQIVNRRRVIGGGVDYTKQYLTFVSMADNNEIKFFTNDATNARIIYVSTDKNTWVSKGSSSAGTTLATLSNGGKLYVKVSVNLTGYSNGTYYHYFEATGDFALEGNIMSLLYSDEFWQQTSLPNFYYTFYGMFLNCTGLVDISKLVMPATTLRQHCYDRMFQGCTKLSSVTCLATDISATKCTNNWLAGVAEKGTFVKAASIEEKDWKAAGVPSGWTVKNYGE